MARRPKRVAAVVAQAKIKIAAEQVVNEENDVHHTQAKRRSSSVFDFDDAVARETQHPSQFRSKKKSDIRQNQQQRSLKSREKGVHHRETTRSFKDVPPKRHSAVDPSANDLFEHLSSSSGSHATTNQQRHEFMTAEKDYVERQRRRSIRSLNSTGPMILSYQTSYRISMSRFSPECSPIVSTRLRFTPVAHIPTTPTHAT